MKFFLFSTLAFLATSNLFAQPTTGQSGTGDNIDVKYHRMEWDINPDNSIWVAGKITTYFVTTKNNVSQLTFDLNRNSYNNSNLMVFYHGVQVTTSFPTTGNRNILRVNLPSTLPIDNLDSVTVQYAGVPPTPSGGPGGCFQKVIAGRSLFYTLSESYEDRDWWPCKADMQDKIDSIDIIITSPSQYTAAANGNLLSEIISGSQKTTTFRHRYPIASYQIGIAVSEYDKFDRGTVNIGGTNVPIIYYILKGRNPSPAQLAQFDACKDELVVFSNLLGDYPFKKEKYGMYEFGFGGGMEHNTFSGMSWSAYLSPTIVAHELMHQWFGDKVTMATWNHLWLSEGFASYGEVLAAERVSSLGLSAAALRAGKKSSANNAGQMGYGCYIPEPYIANSGALWNSTYGSTVYTRGGMVVSMLRTLMGDDKFFRACRNYLSDPDLAYRDAVTADLQRHMEDELDGFDLTGFFDSFVYGNGFPSYTGSNAIQWQALGTDRIRFRRTGQQKSAGSDVGYYFSVIPLRVQGAGGKDTVIVLYDQGNLGVSVGGNGIVPGNSPTPEVFLGFTPTSVSFDPYAMSLATGSTVNTIVVPVTIVSFAVNEKENHVLATLTLAQGQKPSSVVLERSFDGVTFNHLASMAEADAGKYIYEDAYHSGITYYRAKITESTGEVSYSAIIKAGKDKASGFTLVSNPVSQKVKVKVPSEFAQEQIAFIVLDPQGRVVARTVRTPIQDIVEIPVQNLARGTYFLQIQATTTKMSIRFIRE